jgi:transcription antitermination factor NusG
MPLLRAECSLYPANLFEESRRSAPPEHRWWVLHTKPRQEKALARELVDRQVGFYLPLIEKRTRTRGRSFTSHIPLFHSYVFLFGSEEDQVESLSTYRVVNTLEVFDQQQFWNDLTQVYRLITAVKFVRPEERFTPGVKVAIRSGPLAGLLGEVVKTASGNRFVVKVNFLQRGASVVLEDLDLEVVP